MESEDQEKVIQEQAKQEQEIIEKNIIKIRSQNNQIPKSNLKLLKFWTLNHFLLFQLQKGKI